jgi:hypothetical protein
LNYSNIFTISTPHFNRSNSNKQVQHEAINLGYGKKNLIHTRNIGEKPRGHVIGGDDVLVLEPFQR